MILALRRAKSVTHIDHINLLQCIALPSDVPLNPSEGVWWLLYHEDNAVAFAGLVMSRQWTDCMYLCRAGVAPEYRGKGIQKRLIKTRITYATRAGMRWLITDTTDNTPSSNSLIACGFKLYEPARPWGGKRTLYWRKKVAP